jgi:hypothetical protein
MNIAVPVIDHLTKPRIVGHYPREEQPIACEPLDRQP